METKYKIEIPKPCAENWEGMTPGNNGRFCGSCMQDVVDFTNISASEIQNYLLENQGRKICGRFRQAQLGTITIQVPQHILFSQVQFQKMFLLALLLAMGTSLLSCSDRNGEKQRIDRVEIVDDADPVENAVMGMPLPPDSLDPGKKETYPPPPSPKIDGIKAPIATGKSKSASKKSNTPIVLTGAVIIREKDALKKEEK